MNAQWNSRSGYKMCVILLILLQPIKEVQAVKCYYCKWPKPAEGLDLDSTIYGKEFSIYCRPETFNGSLLPIVDCEYGCLTTVITKNVTPCNDLRNHKALRTRKQRVVFGEEELAKFDLYEKLNYSMLVRECSKKDGMETCEQGELQDGCERKSCYCKTDLCNSRAKAGRSGSGSLRKAVLIAGRIAMILIVRHYWIE